MGKWENENSDEIISNKLEELRMLRSEFMKITEKIIGNNLMRDDMYFISIINKAMHLIDGFISMIRNRNLTCEGILLRVQLDNCMRAYAYYIGENQNLVLRTVLDGTPKLSSQKTKMGKE